MGQMAGYVRTFEAAHWTNFARTFDATSSTDISGVYTIREIFGTTITPSRLVVPDGVESRSRSDLLNSAESTDHPHALVQITSYMCYGHSRNILTALVFTQ